MAGSKSFRDADAKNVQRLVNLSRRRFLRGSGAAIALPLLPSLLPGIGNGSVAGATPPELAGSPATTASGAPLRTAFVYFPNGAIPSAWWPSGQSERLDQNLPLNKTTEPLGDVRDKFQILGGLECRAADPGRDGGGSHARAGGSYLTGQRARKTATKIQAGVSIDQVMAQHVGHLTPFRSLELTCDAVHTAGSCDNGYSCAYSYKDVDGNSLLHNSMICYGSGISDGNQHLHTNLPVLLAGGGGGALRPGRYVRSEGTPIANLYLSMADRMGCHEVESHGDSTGYLTQI